MQQTVITDSAPRHAGALFAVSNTIATLPGVIIPPFAGYVVEQTGSVRIVFVLAGTVWIIAGVAFQLLYQGNPPILDTTHEKDEAENEAGH